MTDGTPLTLRRADRTDSADLFAWRNDPDTRANSRNTAPIAWPTHETWLAGALADADRRIWIAERSGGRLGTVSAVRRAEGEVEVSITVAPEVRGRGESAGMIRAAVDAITGIWPGSAVHAAVRVENAASRRSFERCGFAEIGRSDGLLDYRLVRDG